LSVEFQTATVDNSTLDRRRGRYLVARGEARQGSFSTLPPVSARAFAVFMGALAVVGLLAYGVITKGNESLAIGDAAPETVLPTLDGSGTGSLADHRGKWVLVNVWASWCDPCRDESPALRDFHGAHREEGFTVLGIDTHDNSDDGRRFVEEFDLPYPQLHDGDGEYAAELGTTGVPESFLIDPEGNLAVHRPGPVTEEYLQTTILPIISGEESG
jgi:cytochrome c biogenesis protein CcmG, thiol:disulfide interchange protein DsbE